MPCIVAIATQPQLVALVVPPHLDDAERQASDAATGPLLLGVVTGIFLSLLFLWLSAPRCHVGPSSSRENTLS